MKRKYTRNFLNNIHVRFIICLFFVIPVGCLWIFRNYSTKFFTSPSRYQAKQEDLSILAIVANQKQNIHQILPGAELFQVIASLPPFPSKTRPTLEYVWSSYIIPHDANTYIEADSWFINHAQSTIQINTRSYDLSFCSNHFFCRMPKQEDTTYHPPLSDWRIDLKQIVSIAGHYHYKTGNKSDIFITSVQHALYKKYIKTPFQLWQQYPNDSIVVINEEVVRGQGSYLILNATTGELLSKGYFIQK